VKYAISLGLDVMYVLKTPPLRSETIQRLYSTRLAAARSHRNLRYLRARNAMGSWFALHALRHQRSGKAVGENIASSGTVIAIADWQWRIRLPRCTGAEVVHATACGIGERVGNTQMDLDAGEPEAAGIEPWKGQDLTKLKEYCEAVSKATGVPIPKNYPVAATTLSAPEPGFHAAR